MLVPNSGREERRFHGIVIIGLAADAHSGLSDGSLKASLAGVIDQRGGKEG